MPCHRLPRALVLALLLLALGVLPPGASSESPSPGHAWRGGSLTAVSENDEYAFRITVDQHYSNGMRLAWLSDPVDRGTEDPLAWAHRIADHVPGFASSQGHLRLGVAIGHNIYTAGDTRRVVPDANDRPYAGWLYGAIALVHERIPDGPGRGMVETLELTLGTTGPSALASEIQSNWHRLINYPQARGWDSQIRDEPGFGLGYERRWRQPFVAELGLANSGIDIDLVPHVGAGIGNVATYAALGAMLRIGTDLAVDFGPPRTRPALAGMSARRGDAQPAAYAFMGFETRLVGYDLFLDGTMFRDGPQVERRPLVTDRMAGVAVVWRDARASFTYHWRGREFETQGPGDRFGAFSLSWHF